MTKRQPAYSAVPQSCRYLSARPVLTRQVHDSENAFCLLGVLTPFSRWCQVPTFWLSLHSRCPAAYQLRKHVRNSGNPRVLVPAHDLSPYPPRGSPFVIHPVGAKTHVRHVRFPEQPGFLSPAHHLRPKANIPQAPGWLPASKFPVFSHLALDSALPPF